MSWFSKAIRYLFLVKEIISKQGGLHFRRYRLLQTPWFAIYIHQILKSDMDKDPHCHPWNFTSVILEGAYQEQSWYPPKFDKMQLRNYYSGDVIEHQAEDAHKLTLVSQEVWTLVFPQVVPHIYLKHRFKESSPAVPNVFPTKVLVVKVAVYFVQVEVKVIGVPKIFSDAVGLPPVP